MAKLSWIEKRAAAALFAAPPESTYDEAYTHLAHAERLEPGFYLTNRLLLARCCHAMGKRAEAREWLDKCQAMSARDDDEAAALAQAAKLHF